LGNTPAEFRLRAGLSAYRTHYMPELKDELVQRRSRLVVT
jgi:hypothetical protein